MGMAGNGCAKQGRYGEGERVRKREREGKRRKGENGQEKEKNKEERVRERLETGGEGKEEVCTVYVLSVTRTCE